MKIKSLLFSALGLAPFATSSCAVIGTNTMSVHTNETNEDELADTDCSIVYAGKNVTDDGLAIIARSCDSKPRANAINVEIFGHNELANTVVKGNRGFQYKMPSTTYKYISTPRNPYIHKGLHWEASGINEMGVGVSATLSCGTNPVIIDNPDTPELEGCDRFVETGISEDNLAQIMAATASSAKEAMQIVAKIVDTQGNCDPNAIMAIDQNEAWYMELYSGHQYAAIRLPDDRACTIGNEFMLDSIASIYPDYKNHKDWYFTSPNLLKLAVDNHFDKYIGPTHDLEHLDLFHSYAEPLTDGSDKEKPEDQEAARVSNDNSHRRTWRGFSLWDPQSEYAQSYDSTFKYPSFVTPKRKLSVHDIINATRDRFDDILANKDATWDEFRQDFAEGKLHAIGNEMAYQIHVIKSHPELPKEIAVEEWLALGNACASPFVPINNCLTDMIDEYTHKSDGYFYDTDSAAFIYKRINTLADLSRQYYSLPIQYMWEKEELMFEKEYHQVVADAAKLKNKKQTIQAITNFSKTIQQQAINTSKQMFENLLLHVMNDDQVEHKFTNYIPKLNVEDYIKNYGWTNYKKSGNKVTFKSGDDVIKITLPNGDWDPEGNLGLIQLNNQQPISIDLAIDGDNILADSTKLEKYVTLDGQKQIVDFSAKDFIDKINHLFWILPLSFVIVVAAITIPIIVLKGKKKKTKTNKNKATA